MNLSALDLNLLVVLDALLREASVGRAAQAVGLSQPAASHALARLRVLFDDPLLARTGQRMELTPRAEALRRPVELALEQVAATRLAALERAGPGRVAGDGPAEVLGHQRAEGAVVAAGEAQDDGKTAHASNRYG